ncbi:MAG TPA: TonB-dependent receptor [Patescibacteria group bacterium]|nr:TonB-dependent receptor [Patescibacteria group bacterium]
MNRFLPFVFLSFAATPLLAQTHPDSLKTFKNSDSLKVYVTPSVTVTSTRAEERKSPVPFAEITQAAIEQTHTVQDIPALLSDMPSTYFYSESGNGIGYNKMTMRGFDQRRIAVMINGVPQNDPEDHNVYWINFPDMASSLQSIQVQRGAGLSNYGAAAIGGSVNLTTSNFTNERSIRVITGFGLQEYGAQDIFKTNVQKYSIELSSGLTGNYAFYGRLSRINSTGYRDHSGATLNSYFLSAARFDENMTTQLNFFGGPFADQLVYYGVPKAHVSELALRRKNYNYFEHDSTGRELGYGAERRFQEIENFSQPHYELLNDIFLSENFVLKSTAFYYTGDGFFDYDASWADTSTVRLTQDFGFAPTANPGNAIIRGFVGNRHGGWLPRLVWNHGSGELTIGAEARIHRSEHWGKIQYAENLPAGFDPEYKMYSHNGVRDIFSLFAREQYEVLKNVLLNVEGQLVYHRYAIRNERAGNNFTTYQTTSGGIVGNGDEIFNIKYLFFNPRLGVNWNTTENLSIFSSVAFTSREPRMANLYNASESIYGAQPLFTADTTRGSTRFDFSNPIVRPERLLDIELGSRYRDENFSAGVNVYWMEFFDELVKSGNLSIFGSPIDGNAPRTRHIGLELEGALWLFKSASLGNLQLAANANFSRNRIVEYNFVKGDGSTISLADNPISGFPDMLGNLILTYNTGNFNTRIIGKYVGAFTTDLFGNMIGDMFRQGVVSYADNQVEAYTVVNLDATYDFKNILSMQSLRFRAQVTNLFNRLYAAGGEGQDFFPAAERNIYFGVELGL